jgi:hypothetical protein
LDAAVDSHHFPEQVGFDRFELCGVVSVCEELVFVDVE